MQYNERSLWGEMQGSGKNPYQTQVDTAAMAFKCSCPSRKFPCKHGLGLLFLYANNATAFSSTATEPAWVSDWMNKRTEKAEKKVAEPPPITPEKAEKSEQNKAKTVQERLLKVQAGCAELDIWLKDLVRTGLISLPERHNSFFQKTAARMIDSQAKGLANMVIELGNINYYNGTAWQQKALQQICGIFTLLEAFKNIEKLPPAMQEDVRTKIGWPQGKEILENEATEVVNDEWLVIGRRTSSEDDMTVQRNWLYGLHTKRYAFVLNFAHRTQAITTQLMSGMVCKANLAFFPSNTPFRVLVKAQSLNTPIIKQEITSFANWQQANDALIALQEKFFWINDTPQYLANLILIPYLGKWYLKDETGAFLPVHSNFSEEKAWNLLAISGGKPMNFFLLRSEEGIQLLGFIENETYKIL